MCLAAEFAEALVSDVNNPQSVQAIHRDYLDAKVVRENIGFNYFGLNGMEMLRKETKATVETHKKAVELVVEEVAVSDLRVLAT
jgi:hypothetical protein